MTSSAPRPPIGIVIPAHDEESVIGGCLEALLLQTRPGDRVVVVCNGCHDATPDVARRFGSPVQVVEIPTASKVAALNRGDDLLDLHPRLYLDADVELGDGVLDALAAALAGGVELAAPPLTLDITGASLLVRLYLRIWSQLPSVRDDTVGRGAYALSATGHGRIGRFPDVMGDDHYVRDQVPPHARAVVPCAGSTVRASATLSDLVRRRTRTVAGNTQLDGRTSAGRRRARHRALQWVGVVLRDPGLLPLVPIYVGVALWARGAVGAQRILGRPLAWGRDESTRRSPGIPTQALPGPPT